MSNSTNTEIKEAKRAYFREWRRKNPERIHPTSSGRFHVRIVSFDLFIIPVCPGLNNRDAGGQVSLSLRLCSFNDVDCQGSVRK